MTDQDNKRQLSSRELEVLQLSSQGLTDKEIAEQINVSLGTIHTYWTRIRSKSHGKTRAEIVGRHVRRMVLSNVEDHAREAFDPYGFLIAAPAAVVIFDSALRLVFVNRQARRLFGGELEGALNRQVSELNLPQELRGTLIRMLGSAIEESKSQSFVLPSGWQGIATPYHTRSRELYIGIWAVQSTTDLGKSGGASQAYVRL
ncbi:MAG: PAS domain-containing protein [Armatimonadetes bacterium]|nr:PAS domain-containing protein [Armatimonadota bacterium]